MKHTILSILTIISCLVLSYSPIYSQQEDELILEDQSEMEIIQPEEEILEENEEPAEEKTLEDSLEEREKTDDNGLSIFQIFVAITAPLTFFALAYMLINRLKL